MSIRRNSLFGYLLVILGLVLGAVGSVQMGLICIALGTAAVSLATKVVGRVERYLPIALAFCLFAVALALPGGR